MRCLNVFLVFLLGGMLMAFDGICPECKRHGMRSKVYVGPQYSTAMDSHTYYDEEGFYRYEDPNIYTTHYSCTNGHQFVEETRKGNTELSVTVTEEDAEKLRNKGLRWEPYLGWVFPLDDNTLQIYRGGEK